MCCQAEPEPVLCVTFVDPPSEARADVPIVLGHIAAVGVHSFFLGVFSASYVMNRCSFKLGSRRFAAFGRVLPSSAARPPTCRVSCADVSAAQTYASFLHLLMWRLASVPWAGSAALHAKELTPDKRPQLPRETQLHHCLHVTDGWER